MKGAEPKTFDVIPQFCQCKACSEFKHISPILLTSRVRFAVSAKLQISVCNYAIIYFGFFAIMHAHVGMYVEMYGI